MEVYYIKEKPEVDEGPFMKEERAIIDDISERLGRVIERIRIEEELERLNAELERRVADRTARLEAANRELEAFSYSVSHDLRAPLRGIDGFSQMLQEEYADRLNERGSDYVRRVRAASQRMGELIDALLTLSHVSRASVERETLDLSEMAREIAVEFVAEEPDRKVEFSITDGITASADENMLRIVLDNLLSNAWKFTGEHPTARIEFGADEKERETIYFVRDDGAGFDMKYADNLFYVFQRLHGQDEFTGIGIGLATVKRIIDMHGGRIWAEGEVEKGATFYFTLESRND